MKTRLLSASLLLLAGVASAQAADPPAGKSSLDRGRYLVQIGGCNDCHTPGYPEVAGKIPEEKWLTGSPVGFQGPWGTSYPANLRLYTHEVTEQEWLEHSRQPMRPPMPWFALRDMTDDDLAAIYYFIRSLGPAGQPAPPAAAPGATVATPYIEFVPKTLPKHASR